MSRVALFFLLLLCQFVSLLTPIRGLYAVFTNPAQALEIIKGYDLLGNTTFNGSAGEYISSRAYWAMKANKRWGCILCKWLDKVQKNHCAISAGIIPKP